MSGAPLFAPGNYSNPSLKLGMHDVRFSVEHQGRRRPTMDIKDASAVFSRGK